MNEWVRWLCSGYCSKVLMLSRNVHLHHSWVPRKRFCVVMVTLSYFCLWPGVVTITLFLALSGSVQSTNLNLKSYFSCWRALSWAEGCLKETFYKKKNIKLNWWISLLRPSEWAFWTMFKPKAKQIVEKWSQRPYKSTSSEKVVSVALNLLEVRHAHRLALIIWPQRVHSSTMQTLSNQFFTLFVFKAVS